MKDKLNILFFFALLIAFFSLILLAPDDERILTVENRSPEKVPPLNLHTALNGEFSRAFEGYIADRVGFRTDLILLSKRIEAAYGVIPEDGPSIVIVQRPDGRDTAAPIEPAPIEPAPEREEGDEGGAGDGESREAEGESDLEAINPTGAVEHIEPIRAGSLLAFPDKLMEIYTYNEASCIRYAQIVNAYAEDLDGRARVFSLLAPTQIEFVDERYSSVSDSQRRAIHTVYSRLEGARPVDAYARLQAHKDEYIYFRSDHHWTALGAYYAYTAFAEAAGFAPIALELYESYSAPGFLGYLYNMNPTDRLKDDPDTIVYYEYMEPLEVSSPLIYRPAEDQAPTYGIFIGGDYPLYTISTSVDNGRTCIVVKDSYANAFIPWLAPHYEHILVIDPRYFEGSVRDTVAMYEDVDLILLDYVIATSLSSFMESIDSIR